VSEQPDLPPSFSAGTYQRRAPRDQEKAETQRLGLIVLGIVGLLAVGVLARSLLSGHTASTTASDGGSVPLIAPTGSNVKTPPANPGGLQVPGADQDVLGASGSGAANGQLAPGPETPAPAQLAAEPPAAPPTATPAPATPPAPTVNFGPVAKSPPAPPPALTEASPTVIGRAPAEAVDQAAPAAAQSEAAPGAHMVQLGALPTHAEAVKEWRRLIAKMPALFQGRTPRITSVAVSGHLMYRLRTGGFADRDDAVRFCSEMSDRHVRCEVR